MARVLAFLTVTTILAGCAAHEIAAPPPPPVVEAVPVPEAPPAPKPQYGAYGFDAAGMDTSVVPGDNFYQYANGIWAKNTPIPADKSNYGMSGYAEEQLRHSLGVDNAHFLPKPFSVQDLAEAAKRALAAK